MMQAVTRLVEPQNYVEEFGFNSEDAELWKVS